LAHYGPREQSACRKALIRATSQATEASHLLDLHLPTAQELETRLRSALAMVPERPTDGLIAPTQTLEAIEKA
jgi:hypothetical protein